MPTATRQYNKTSTDSHRTSTTKTHTDTDTKGVACGALKGAHVETSDCIQAAISSTQRSAASSRCKQVSKQARVAQCAAYVENGKSTRRGAVR